MPRKSAYGLPAGIQKDRHGAFWATLTGKYATMWRERFPGTSLPRRKAVTIDQAAELQRTLIDDLKAGKDPNADNPTIAAYVETWINQRQTLAASTRQRYDQALRLQLKTFRLGRMRLRQVSHDYVAAWVRELVVYPRADDPDQPLDAHTIRNAFAVLRAALNTAVTHGLIPNNPCRGVELPAIDDDEITPLTPAEVDTLLDLVDAFELDRATGRTRPHRYAALYHLAIRLGLRQGELLGLRWKDVDLDRSELRVAGQHQRRKRTKGKTRHAHRTLPLSADLVRVLRAHLANQREEQRLSGESWNKAELVFCTANGTPIGATNVWHSYKGLLRRAGLSTTCVACKGSGKLGATKKVSKCAACDGHGVIALFRFHDLRHTYATLSLAAGVELFTLSRRMGHSSISITADRYGHLYTGQAHDANAIDRLLKRGA